MPLLTGKDFAGQFRRTRINTSTGTDGWRSKELKLLPEPLLEPLAWLFNAIEAGAPWPDTLLYAIIAMLAKKGQDPLLAGPLKQRPVSVASVLYRAYSSLRYRHLCPWMASWIHENFRGGVPGGDCKDLTIEMGLDIESAAADGEALWGLNEDIKKYYDTMVRQIIFSAAQKLGAPSAFMDSQLRFYAGLQRAFKYGRSIGPFFLAMVSVLQGCALSQIWANIDGSCWAWAVEAKASVTLGGFIDDKSLRSRRHNDVQKGADASTEYHRLSGQDVEPTKSRAWCTRRTERAAAPRISLAGKPVRWVDTEKS
jgi:hypothetical protein